MRNKLGTFTLSFMLFLVLQFRLTANTYPIQKVGFSKFVKDTIYVLPEEDEIQKQLLLKKIRTFNTISNIALILVPASILTLGLSLIGGFVLAIVSFVYFTQIKKVLEKYPGFENDPVIEKKMMRSNIKLGFLVLLYGLFVLLFAFLLAEIFFFAFDGNEGLNLTVLVGTLFSSLLLLFDKLIFRSKPK